MTWNAFCRRSTERLTEYLENTLSPRRRQGIERHLAQCEACSRRLAQLQQIIATSGETPRERVPQAMKARLLRQLVEPDRSGTEAADQR